MSGVQDRIILAPVDLEKASEDVLDSRVSALLHTSLSFSHPSVFMAEDKENIVGFIVDRR